MFPERLAETQERQQRYRHGHIQEWRRRQAVVDERFAQRRDAIAEVELATMLAASDDEIERMMNGQPSDAR